MIEHLGRWLVVIGVAVALGGGLLILMGRLVPSGRLLPGDIVVRRPGFTLYFPLVTCVVLSLALTVVLWLVALLRR